MKRTAMWSGLAIAGVVLAVLFVHAWSYRAFFSDDGLISLRYAKHLLAGHGLVWNIGERVEGYTNLLWVLACAAVGALGVDLVLAARVLGFLGMAVALLAVVRVYAPGTSRRQWSPLDLLPALTGALLLAAAGPIAGWTFGGLEPPLLAALLAGGIAACFPLLRPEWPPERWPLAAALWLGFLCWVRADAALLAASVVLGIVAARRADRVALRLGLRLGSVVLGFVLLQSVFRRAYYGDWVPNTARVRVAFTSQQLRNGIAYLWDAVPEHLPILVATVAALVVLRAGRARRRAVLLLVPSGVWCAYVAVVGGDTQHLHRHLIPVLVCGAFLVAEGLAAIARGPRVAVLVAAAALVTAQFVLSDRDREKRWATSELWVMQSKSIGQLLGRIFGPTRALLAIDPAGGVPFWSDLPAIDMLGLNDAWIARHPPPDFGRGWTGHELGDGNYVLRRQPDLILFCSPFGAAKPCLRSGRELVQMQAFWRDYTLVTLAMPESLQARIWVRRESATVGIQRRSGAVVIPGILLNAYRESVAVLAGDSLGARVDARHPAAIAAVALEPGKWRLEVAAVPLDAGTATGESLAVTVRRSGSGEILAPASARPSFEAGDNLQVDVQITTRGAPVQVRGIAFRRARS